MGQGSWLWSIRGQHAATMKILMCNSFYYLKGGSERCFFDLSEQLASHGHQVIPFSMADDRNLPSEYSRFFVDNVDFPTLLRQGGGLGTRFQTLARVLYSFDAKDKIAQLIEETKPDIAHVHGIAHEISPSILVAIKQAGIPIVQTLHDYFLLCPNTSFISKGEVCERCKKRRYYQVVARRCKRDSLPASALAGLEMYVHKLLRIYERHVDVFIAPSEFLKDKMAEYGIKAKVVNLPNSVDLQRFEPCYDGQKHFIFVGRLARIKGVMTLMKAMRQVEMSHLYLAGEGELRSDLEGYAAQHGISNVTFLGHLATEDLIPLVQQAAFTVLPSECYENYPMAILESFACGTPVIGSDLGGIPDLVRDGQNGLLFRAGDANQLAGQINSLLRHPERATEMGRNGRRRVEEVNNPQRHYERTMELYQSLLD